MRKLSDEKMTSKERVLATMNFQETDRVPIDYDANKGIDLKLKKHFGLEANDRDGIRDALGVDMRGIKARYNGPRLHDLIKDRQVSAEWGWRTKWIEHATGGYWDFCDFPLEFAEYDEVLNWPMPSVDNFDYDSLEEKCEKYKDYALYVGDPGLACIMNTAGFFRGMEQHFVDLALDEPAGLLLVDRFIAIQYEQTKRILERVGDKLDYMWLGEDLGTQHTPIIGKEIFYKHIISRQKPFFDLAKEYNLPVMLHTCGSSSWSYEDYIKIGLNGVDTLQPEATDMSPKYLKEKFGGRLFFHGSISTAGAIAYGSTDDVIKEVKDTLDVMMPGGGYMLSPTHSIQDNSPVENVLAMYEAAHKYGRYDTNKGKY